LRFGFQRLPPIPQVGFELKFNLGNFRSNASGRSSREDCKNQTRRLISSLDFCGRMHTVLALIVRRWWTQGRSCGSRRSSWRGWNRALRFTRKYRTVHTVRDVVLSSQKACGAPKR